MAFRIPLAGLAAICAGGFALIDASNTDFSLFGPVGLNVAMFLALVAVTGSVTAWLDYLLQRRLQVNDIGDTITYAALIGVGALIALPLTFSLFFVAGADFEELPRIAGGFFCVAALGILLSWTGYTTWGRPILSNAGKSLGAMGIAGLLAFGGLRLAGEMTEIL